MSLVNLNWNYSNLGLQKSNIYRSVNGGLFNFLAQVLDGTTSYVDQDLLADQDTYAYQVAHYDAETNNESERAGTSTFTIYTTMPVPTNLQGSGTVNGVVLTWDYTTAAASFLTGFNIRRKLHTAPDQPSSWTTLSEQGANSRTMTDTDTLLTGIAYDYQIDALYDGGSSAWSSSTTVTTYSPAPPPPTAPSNLAVTGHSSSSVSLSWTDSPTSGASYVLQYSLNNSTWFDFDTNIAIGATTYTAGNLNASTLYYFRMYAFTSVGGRSTSPSNTVSQTTDAAGSRTLVQFPGDYTYLGSFRPPTITGVDTRYARGLTFREVSSDTGNTKHLLMTLGPNGNGNTAYSVIEFRIPADGSLGTGGSNVYNPNNYPSSTGGKTYGRNPYITAGGKFLGPITELAGNNGIGWDETGNRLWWTVSSGYSNVGYFGYSSLDYTAGTAVCTGGRWVFDHPQYKATSGGIIIAPQTYATSYLNGARLCWGFGGNQSVVTQGDQSLGFSLTASAFSEVTFPGDDLRVTDLVSAGGTSPGNRVVTSASNPFTAGMVGHAVWTFFPGQPNIQAHTIASVQSSSQATLDSTPSGTSALTGGTLSGMGTIVTDKIRLISSDPYSGSPGSGLGRMNRATGTDRIQLGTKYRVFNDSWPVNKIYYCDNPRTPVWVDSTDRYGVIVFCEIGLRMTYYLNADIYPSYANNSVAVYDPYKFAPASGSNYYDIQPDSHELYNFPFLNYTSWAFKAATPPNIAMQPFVTVTSIASDASKKGNNTTGCLVTAPNHGLTNAPNPPPVEIYGSTDEFNSLWFFNVVDTDHGYIFNPQNGTFWSGATDTQAGITIANLGGKLHDSHGGIVGCTEDPLTHYLYVAVQIQWGVNNLGGGGPLIAVLRPNFS